MGVLLVQPVTSADILSDSEASFSILQGSLQVDAGGWSYDPSWLLKDYFWTKNCLANALGILGYAPATLIEHTSPDMSF